MSINGRTLILYQYQASSFSSDSGIDTDGRTYVRNIPFEPMDAVSDRIVISVFITINSTTYPQSQLFTAGQCTIRDTTTTGT